jgi:phosphopantothenoylcysteine decarboxylase/phosphopantothenate--cysteine ligase
MTEPAILLGHIRFLLTRQGAMQGVRVVVTAGGTQEPIDPVRLITNRSSGKQGFALAQSALDAGAQVTLISTPVSLEIPQGAEHILVRTAAEMESAVLKVCQQSDVLLMAAAVSDFRPTKATGQKIKKASGVPVLELEPTSDILSAVYKARLQTNLPRVVVGFAAETQDLLPNAAAKLKSKHLDLIVVNDVSSPTSGFSVDTNQVTLVYPEGRAEPLSLLTKSEVADRVIAEVVKLLTK